jgi:hypothetical protein
MKLKSELITGIIPDIVVKNRQEIRKIIASSEQKDTEK